MSGPTKLIVLVLLLSGCAAGPKFDSKDVDKTLTPPRAAAEIDSRHGARVIWGGVILATHNLKDATQLEVLAYPLDSSFRPDDEAAPLGRFLIVKPGYVEPADYAVGRLISVSGSVQATQTGQIGEVAYTYPVVQPDGLHLWRRGSTGPDTGVHFGFGVNIIR